MKQITIFKNGIISNQAQFSTQEEVDSWFSKEVNNKSFGSNASSYEQLVSEEIPAVYEDQEVLDELGASFDSKQLESVEIQAAIPAVFETIEVPAEYSVEVVDITDQLALQAESRAALAYLFATDYIVLKSIESGISLSAEFKAERDAARLKVINSI